MFISERCRHVNEVMSHPQWHFPKHSWCVGNQASDPLCEESFVHGQYEYVYESMYVCVSIVCANLCKCASKTAGVSHSLSHIYCMIIIMWFERKKLTRDTEPRGGEIERLNGTEYLHLEKFCKVMASKYSISTKYINLQSEPTWYGALDEHDIFV